MERLDEDADLHAELQEVKNYEAGLDYDADLMWRYWRFNSDGYALWELVESEQARAAALGRALPEADWLPTGRHGDYASAEASTATNRR